MLSLVMMCLLFLTHYKKIKEGVERKSWESRVPEISFKFFSLGTTMLALSFYSSQNDLTFNVGGYSCEQFSVITLILSKLLAIAIKLLHGSILPS